MLQNVRHYYSFVFVILCIFSLPCSAKTYTVSAKQSLSDAVKKLRSGDTLLLKGGVYRQTISIPSRSWSSPVTIMGVPGENAIIKGSNLVTNWASIGGGTWIKRDWRHNSQQVFIDGERLRQIGGTIFGNYPASGCESGLYRCGGYTDRNGGAWPGRVRGDKNDLVKNSFYYDKKARALYIRTDRNPNKATVEASVRPQWIKGSNISGLRIKNLILKHANTSASIRGGAVSLAPCNKVTLDSIKAVYADWIAITLRGNNNTIKNSTIRHAGAIGISGSGNNLKILNNVVRHNNYRGFHHEWGGSGMKIIGGKEIHGFGGIKDSEVSGNKVIFNNGDGIWCDHCIKGRNHVRDNIIAYNRRGIHWEVSNNSSIYNNIIFRNSNTGLYTSGSNGNLIAHNLIMFNNGPEGNLAITERTRYENPNGNTAVGNLIGWGKNGRELFLPEKIGNNRSDYNLILTVNQPKLFHGNRKNFYTSLAGWRQATDQDRNSWNRKMESPIAVREALQKKTTRIDWTPVLKIAKKYSVRGKSLGNIKPNGTPPGPAT